MLFRSNSFFLLRTEVVINGQKAVVGTDEKGWLTLNSRYPEVGVTFDSLVTDLNMILQKKGMEPVTNYWCEEAPIFEVRVSSQKDLKRLLHLEGVIKEELATKINGRMMAQMESPDSSAHPPGLHVLVQPKVYFLVPDSCNKDGSIAEVTEENVLSSIGLCIDNKVFNFGALFRAFRTNPKRVDTGTCICTMYMATHFYYWYTTLTSLPQAHQT